MWRTFLDLLYPPRCGLCGVFGPIPICPVCASEFVPRDDVLRRSTAPLKHEMVLFRYETRAAQAVRRLKYSRVTSLVDPLAGLMRAGYENSGLDATDVIVPIPIHWTRRAARGFNQAEELCQLLPTEKVRLDLLHRVRATKPQAGLGREERIRNLNGAFRASRDVAGLSVLLVDDVTTSGHTAECCAEALLAAGANDVSLLALTG